MLENSESKCKPCLHAARTVSPLGPHRTQWWCLAHLQLRQTQNSKLQAQPQSQLPSGKLKRFAQRGVTAADFGLVASKLGVAREPLLLAAHDEVTVYLHIGHETTARVHAAVVEVQISLHVHLVRSGQEAAAAAATEVAIILNETAADDRAHQWSIERNSCNNERISDEPAVH